MRKTSFASLHCRVRTSPGFNLGQLAALCIPCTAILMQATLASAVCIVVCPKIRVFSRILHFHPLSKFTPPVCHCPLPLLFGPLRVWIRRLRLCSLPICGHLENTRICSQLHRADTENFLFLLASFFGFHPSAVCVSCLPADFYLH